MDASTWTSNSIPEWGYQLAFGNGVFVAASAYRIYTSRDGATWTNRSENLGGFQDLRFLNGIFVGTTSDFIATSADGLSWFRSGSSGAGVQSVAYGNGRFVGVGAGGEIISSDDAQNWTRRSHGTHQRIKGLASGGGWSVAVADPATQLTGSTLLASSNAFDWVECPANDVGYLSGVAYGAEKFVAVSQKGVVLVSTNTTKWDQLGIDGTNAAYITFVDHCAERFFAGSAKTVYVSADATGWRKVVFPNFKFHQFDVEQEPYLWGIAFGNGTYVAVGPVPYTSRDGENWTPQRLPWSQRRSSFEYWLTDVAFGNGLFVATHYDNSQVGEQIFTSPDGITWEQQSVPSTTFLLLLHITYSGGWFLAVGPSASMIASPDGVNWRVLKQDSSLRNLTAATFGFGTFLVGGEWGTILQSGSLNPRIAPPQFGLAG